MNHLTEELNLNSTQSDFSQEGSIHYSGHLVGICTEHNVEALTRKYWYSLSAPSPPQMSHFATFASYFIYCTQQCFINSK